MTNDAQKSKSDKPVPPDRPEPPKPRKPKLPPGYNPSVGIGGGIANVQIPVKSPFQPTPGSGGIAPDRGKDFE